MSKDLKAAARRWAHEYMLCNFEIPEHAQDDEYMAAKYITQCLAPPTMEELPWDHGRHYLAGATDGEYDYVMISPYRHDEESFLEIATIDCGSSNLMMVDAHSLIPNGKKYELVEVTGDEHPETLRTLADYGEAPVGTIVDIDGTVAVREELGWFYLGEEEACNSWSISRLGEGEVVRWGRGKDGEPCAPTISSNENVDPDQKEHPETLRTAEDYKDAPVGTVVAHNGCFPYVKQGRDVWTDTFDDKCSDDFLSGISRQVLRRGWGE